MSFLKSLSDLRSLSILSGLFLGGLSSQVIASSGSGVFLGKDTLSKETIDTVKLYQDDSRNYFLKGKDKPILIHGDVSIVMDYVPKGSLFQISENTNTSVYPSQNKYVLHTLSKYQWNSGLNNVRLADDGSYIVKQDIDKDGQLDLMVMLASKNEVAVFTSSHGAWQSHAFKFDASSEQVKLIDINDDGLLDLRVGTVTYIATSKNHQLSFNQENSAEDIKINILPEVELEQSAAALDDSIEALDPVHHYVVDDIQGNILPDRVGNKDARVFKNMNNGKDFLEEDYIDLNNGVSSKGLVAHKSAPIHIDYQGLKKGEFGNGFTWILWYIKPSKEEFQSNYGHPGFVPPVSSPFYLKSKASSAFHLRFTERPLEESTLMSFTPGFGHLGNKYGKMNDYKGLTMIVVTSDGKSTSVYNGTNELLSSPFTTPSYLNRNEFYTMLRYATAQRIVMFDRELNVGQIKELHEASLIATPPHPDLTELPKNHQLYTTRSNDEFIVPGIDSGLWAKTKKVCGHLTHDKFNVANLSGKDKEAFFNKIALINQKRLQKCLKDKANQFDDFSTKIQNNRSELIIDDFVLEGLNLGGIKLLNEGNGASVLVAPKPPIDGISVINLESFKLNNKKLSLKNTSEAIFQNSNGRTAETIIINSKELELQSEIELIGEPADLIIVSPNSFSCTECKFTGFERVTLLSGSVDLGANSTQIGKMIPYRNNTIKLEKVKAPGIVSFDVIAASIEVGDIDTNVRAYQGSKGSFELNPNGDKVLGSGGINFFQGKFEFSYKNQSLSKRLSPINSNYGNAGIVVSGEVKAASINFISNTFIKINNRGKLTTKSDGLITSSYKGQYYPITEGIRLFSMTRAKWYQGSYRSGSVENFGSIESDNKISVDTQMQFENQGKIQGRSLKLQSGSTLQNKGRIISQNDLSIVGAKIRNSDLIQAERVHLFANSDIFNHSGGVILGSDLNFESISFRNGFVSLEDNQIPEEEIGFKFFTQYIGPNEEVKDYQANQNSEAFIFGKNIIISSENFSNINSYYVMQQHGNEWSNGIPMDPIKSKQVAIYAENSLEIAAKNEFKNISGVVGLNQSGTLKIESNKIINSRFKVLAFANLKENKRDSSIATNLYIFSPPGLIYSFGDFHSKGGHSFINDTSFFEVHGDAKFDFPNGKVISKGIEMDEEIRQSVVKHYIRGQEVDADVCNSEKRHIYRMICNTSIYTKETARFRVKPKQQQTLFHIGGDIDARQSHLVLKSRDLTKAFKYIIAKKYVTDYYYDTYSNLSYHTKLEIGYGLDIEENKDGSISIHYSGSLVYPIMYGIKREKPDKVNFHLTSSELYELYDKHIFNYEKSLDRYLQWWR